MKPAFAYDNPATSLAIKYVHTSTNKNKFSVNVVKVLTPKDKEMALEYHTSSWYSPSSGSDGSGRLKADGSSLERAVVNLRSGMECNLTLKPSCRLTTRRSGVYSGHIMVIGCYLAIRQGS
jgi:hypothetical protein